MFPEKVVQMLLDAGADISESSLLQIGVNPTTGHAFGFDQISSMNSLWLLLKR